MNILVINAGSSSLKYQLIDMTKHEVLAKGLCERIGIGDSKLKHTPAGGEAVIINEDMIAKMQAMIKTISFFIKLIIMIYLVENIK